MCVKDTDLFVTVQIFEATPPVLSLGEHSAMIMDVLMSGPVVQNHN